MANLTKTRMNLSRQTLNNQTKSIFSPVQKIETVRVSLPNYDKNSKGNNTSIYAELFKQYAEEVKLRTGLMITPPQINHAALSKSIYDFNPSNCLSNNTHLANLEIVIPKFQTRKRGSKGLTGSTHYN